jgi:predicted nucleotidyltransferase
MGNKAKATRTPANGHTTRPDASGTGRPMAGKFPILVEVDPELGARITQITEWYRLEKRSQQTAYIKRLVRQIVEGFHPDKIILFGSRAYGKPREDSDIDLLVIRPYDGNHAKEAIQILNHLDVLAPIDLLVRSPEEIRERIEIGDQFIREIVGRGKVLYEANHARVGRQG